MPPLLHQRFESSVCDGSYHSLFAQPLFLDCSNQGPVWEPYSFHLPIPSEDALCTRFTWSLYCCTSSLRRFQIGCFVRLSWRMLRTCRWQSKEAWRLGGFFEVLGCNHLWFLICNYLQPHIQRFSFLMDLAQSPWHHISQSASEEPHTRSCSVWPSRLHRRGSHLSLPHLITL